MSSIDPNFLALPLSALADAALSRAAALGCKHADVRVERIRSGIRSYRDRDLQTSQDSEELGLSVRVLHDGAWGFAAGITLSTDSAARLAERAVATARVSKPLTRQPVELADEPTYPDGSWVSAYEVNPFDVPETDRQARIGRAHRCPARGRGRHPQHRGALVGAGEQVLRQPGRDVHPATTGPDPAAVHRRPRGRARLLHDAYAGRPRRPRLGVPDRHRLGLRRRGRRTPRPPGRARAAPSVEPGRYDLVVDPTNLWLTIHESIAHATELDRALGYEAAYAGTTFATVDQLGTLQYGSPQLFVTGDRITEHGLSTVGWDDEGVAAQEFDIIADGTLVGYQLDRQMATKVGRDRSNGCAFADSSGHIPLQRMPNVSRATGAGRAEHRGVDRRRGPRHLRPRRQSWSIDMQRYNFQFTGQRFFRIEEGKLAGQLRDVAYQATTTDFWRSLDGLGGPQTYHLGGAFNCGKGQPGQTAPVSHGAPSALFRSVNILNTQAEGGH